MLLFNHEILIILGLIITFLLPFSWADRHALAHINDRQAPREDDECFVLIRSESSKKLLEEKYGIEFQHKKGDIYTFPCLGSSSYTPPLLTREMSTRERKDTIEKNNKMYINNLASDPNIEEIVYGEYPNKIIPLEYKTPSDSETKMLWHLSKNFGSNFKNVAPTSNVNVEPIWEQGYSGKGVTILFIDDGLLYKHKDFTGRVNLDLCLNMCSETNQGKDPTPSNMVNYHGTAVAGVAAGGIDDGICAIGPSYQATIAARSLLCTTSIKFTQVVKALDCESCNIINNSWGDVSCTDYNKLYGWGCEYIKDENIITEFLKVSSDDSIYLFSSGNYGDMEEYSNMHLYARSIYTINVGAVEASGVASYYTDPGPNVDISAPSNGYGLDNGTVQIYTTGIESETNCDPSFGGTSSSCPLVSGVVGLILEISPHIKYRDLRYIFAYTAVNIDLEGNSESSQSRSKSEYWIENDSGVRHNVYYGFGKIDAEVSVSMAKMWGTNVGPLSDVTLDPKLMIDKDGNEASGDIDSTMNELTVEFNIGEELLLSNHFIPQFVETISVMTEINFHSNVNFGGMTIKVISPAGTESILMKEYKYADWQIKSRYEFSDIELTSHQFFGESSLGKWKVVYNFKDYPDLDANVASCKLKLYGVRNDLTILNPAKGYMISRDCYSFKMRFAHKDGKPSTTIHYKAKLFGLADNVDGDKPTSPASKWSYITDLTVPTDSTPFDSDATEVSFLVPSKINDFNYPKYRVIVTEIDDDKNNTMLALGSYNEVAKSQVFSFTDSDEGECDIYMKEMEKDGIIDRDYAKDVNENGTGCFVVDGNNISSYSFRTISGNNGMKYSGKIRVRADEYQNYQSIFNVKQLTEVTGADTVYMNNGCVELAGFKATGYDNVVAKQLFNVDTLNRSISKFVVDARNGKDGNYEFNFNLFDKIENFVFEGKFRKIFISNANIVNLSIINEQGVNTTDFAVEIINSSIDSLDINNVRSVFLSRNYIGQMELSAKTVDIKTFVLGRPYGFTGVAAITGSYMLNNKVVGSGTNYYSPSDDSQDSIPDMKNWNIVADTVSITEL